MITHKKIKHPKKQKRRNPKDFGVQQIIAFKNHPTLDQPQSRFEPSAKRGSKRVERKPEGSGRNGGVLPVRRSEGPNPPTRRSGRFHQRAYYQPRMYANIKGAQIVASDSTMYEGVVVDNLPQVIFSFGIAPEYEPYDVVESEIWQKYDHNGTSS